ncbi:unnamed protein product [Pseudo-nitzschia multistriata]|uniref:Uncharacterized protein n=1 Tax=Pseudo-nitzschia multistriata TaxID=183589 RepID=A0A448Z5N8_9STRA|nr:unnamed protein product [Pseudo-nitzschia multistriata]
MFDNSPHNMHRIDIEEEKKDQSLDVRGNDNFIHVSGNLTNKKQNCVEEKKEQPDVARIEASEVSGELNCNNNLNDILRRRRRSSSPSSLQVSTASIDVILPEKDYNPSLEILRSFSSESMRAISKSQSADPDFDRGLRSKAASVTVEPVPIPRRNLTEAFEELYIKPSKSWANSVTDSPNLKNLSGLVGKSNTSGSSNIISPTGVAELETAASSASMGTTLSSPTSTSNLITPIKSDPTEKDEAIVEKKTFQFRLHPQLQRDMSDALVRRVCFYSIIHDINKEATTMASNDDSGYNRNPDEIDEKFDPLVMAVHGRSRSEFTGSSSIINVALIDEEEWLLEAINSRNPDEARSVNACPPTFLQAIGERDYENPLTSLSSGSRTQLWKPSRSWWEAKSGKNPWIEPNSHNKRWRYLWPLIHYHKFLAKCIKKLKRNSVCVKNSVSPVAVFLREEVCAVSDHLASVSLFDSEQWMDCLQHFEGWVESSEEAAKSSREFVSKLRLRSLNEPGDVDSTLLRNQIDEQLLRAIVNAREQLAGKDISKEERRSSKQPMRRRERNQTGSVKSSLSVSSVDAEAPCPRHISTHNSKGRQGLQRNWQGYPHHGWWQNGWQHHHHPYPYGDDAVPGTPDGHNESQNSSLEADQEPTELPESSENPNESFDTHRTPYKPRTNHVPMSPYWGHLQDHATLAMMGLSSPPGSVPPTPHRNVDSSFSQEDMSTVEMKNNMNAQPLLLRQQYYGYGYGSREGYAPPSPATQFMMSPQASFAYNYGYGFSPSRRSTSQTKLLNTSISEEEIDALHSMPEGGNAIPEATNGKDDQLEKDHVAKG